MKLRGDNIRFQDEWTYPQKSCSSKTVDVMFLPLRLAIGGRKLHISPQKVIEAPNSSSKLQKIILRIICMAISILFFPFTLTVLAIKFSILRQEQNPQNPVDYTRMKLKNYLFVTLRLTKQEMHQGCDKYITDFILEQRYGNRSEVIYFDKNKKNQFPQQIAFAYTKCFLIKEKNPDYSKVQSILEKIAFGNVDTPIPKLFIPMGVYPKDALPHALLLIIEADPKNPKKARISLVNSFGDRSTTYKSFEDQLINISKQVFSSPQTTVIKNPIVQQLDGFSCGWHMLENIDFLSHQENIQRTVKDGKLPVRSNEEIAQIYNSYKNYANQAILQWNEKTTEMDRKIAYDQLLAEGRFRRP